MRNDFAKRPEFSFLVCPFFFLFLLFCTTATSAQKLHVDVIGNSVTIKTNFTNNAPYPMDTQNGETAFGFFYRIDSDLANNNDGITGNEGSFYWKDDMPGGTTTITKTINLPSGKYSLVAYQSRKSRPVRSLIQDKPLNPVIFEVPVPVGPSSNTFEAVDMKINGAVSPIKLDNSWNVFKDPANVSDPVDHHVFNTAIQPKDQPWLFITLSVSNLRWLGQLAILNYNEKVFTYGGAVFGNEKNDFSGTPWISGITNAIVSANLPTKQGELRITPGILPVNSSKQTHIHLIFQVKQDAQFFSEYVDFSAKLDGGNPVILSLPVKPKPHDPNKLVVDKKTICPCGPAIPLKYRVEFQNIGNGPVNRIGISLVNTAGLNMGSLRLLKGTTYKKNAAIAYSTDIMARPPAYSFDITGINLPGTNQTIPRSFADDETWDYIEFEIQTNSCIKDGTFIRPQASVYFYGTNVTFVTNIGETQALYSAGQSTDGAPIPCSSIVKKTCLNCAIKADIKERN